MAISSEISCTIYIHTSLAATRLHLALCVFRWGGWRDKPPPPLLLKQHAAVIIAFLSRRDTPLRDFVAAVFYSPLRAGIVRKFLAGVIKST